MNSSWSDIMLELRQEYLQSMPGRIEALRRAGREEDFTEFANQCHRLKGTGKTYGLSEISEVSAFLESRLNETGLKLSAVAPPYCRLLEEIHQHAIVSTKPFDYKKSEHFQKLQNEA